MEILLPLRNKKNWQYVILIWRWGLKIGVQPLPVNGESFFDFETVWPKKANLEAEPFI